VEPLAMDGFSRANMREGKMSGPGEGEVAQLSIAGRPGQWRVCKMMTRDEHIEECKKRALFNLDRGDSREAFTSMLIDVPKHPDCTEHPGLTMGVGFMMLPGWIDNPVEVRRWIVGFR
jgi:hypothetical protein